MLYGPYVLSGDCYLSDLFAQLTQLMAALPADKIASHSQIGKLLTFISTFLKNVCRFLNFPKMSFLKKIDTLPTALTNE